MLTKAVKERIRQNRINRLKRIIWRNIAEMWGLPRRFYENVSHPLYIQLEEHDRVQARRPRSFRSLRDETPEEHEVRINEQHRRRHERAAIMKKIRKEYHQYS